MAIFPLPPQNTPVFVKTRGGSHYMHRSWVQYFQNLAQFFGSFIPSVSNPTVNNFAALDESGGIIDSGVDETSFAPRQHTHQDFDQGGQVDHGLGLTGLTDDDHTQYLLLSGRNGQSINDYVDFSGSVSTAGLFRVGDSLGQTDTIFFSTAQGARVKGGIIVEVL